MSGLRLALPECKYRNDSDELLKDQFIFGIYNKEIQDHLLGEIKETDNSVRALCEARKIESKLAQRKMLGIANPNNLVSVDEVRKKSTSFRGKDTHYIDCNYCGCDHKKGDCPAFGIECHKCGRKNHFSKMCRSQGSNKSESKRDSRKPSKATGKCTQKCRVHEINKCQNDMEDLSEQVQSLFYS